jgi:uncharacterized membrane protein YdjX (TVP38/TMEM64 family)
MRWLVVAALLGALILVPFVLFEQSINSWVKEVLRADRNTGAIAATVMLLLALDVLLPVPSSIVSTAAGAMLGLLPGIAASTVGMTLGCALGYACGRIFGLPLVRRFVAARDLEQVSLRFQRGAVWALATMRPVPVLAEASALFAGLAGVPFPRYIGITTLANAGISIIYCAAGAKALQSGSFLLAFAGAVVLPALATAIYRRLPRARRSRF